MTLSSINVAANDVQLRARVDSTLRYRIAELEKV